MEFREYEVQATLTAVYPYQGQLPIYPVLGLVGEAGEVAEKVKKIIRDKDGELTEPDRELLILELGDVLWYLSAVSRDIGSSLNEVADANIRKLRQRQLAGTLQGSGDVR
jgi:NTP pyrophosphatase (non-canonical NTP hydrolase)